MSYEKKEKKEYKKNTEDIYIEGVLVCVNYADFLAHTLPSIKGLFNNLVIVTDLKDQQTKKLCEYYHVQCVMTNAFYEDGAVFNKGKGINEGLKMLSMKGWVAHIDADIYFPPLTRWILNNIEPHLHKDYLYGVDRMMCASREEWDEFIDDPTHIHQSYTYVHPSAFKVGTRIADYTGEHGWHPIGYFQMWYPETSGIYTYPTSNNGADHTDVVFSKNWDRSKRSLIPELVCIHLDSEGYSGKEMGTNWNGRKTMPFKRS